MRSRHGPTVSAYGQRAKVHFNKSCRRQCNGLVNIYANLLSTVYVKMRSSFKSSMIQLIRILPREWNDHNYFINMYSMKIVMFCLFLFCSILLYSFSILRFLYRARLYQKTDFLLCKLEFLKTRGLLICLFITSCFVSVNCRWICLESRLLHSELQSWRLQWLLRFPRLLLPWRIHHTAWSPTALRSFQRPWREIPADSRNGEPFLWNPQGHTSSSGQPHQIPASCPWPAVMGQPSLEAVAPSVLLLSLAVLLLWLWLRRETARGAFRINKL